MADVFSGNPVPTYHPEFGRFMLEATPGEPYGVGWSSLLAVEGDMKRRYCFRSESGFELTFPGAKSPA